MSKVRLLRIFCNPRSVLDPLSSDGLSNGSQETGVERKVVGAVIQYICGLMLRLTVLISPVVFRMVYYLIRFWGSDRFCYLLSLFLLKCDVSLRVVIVLVGGLSFKAVTVP